MEIMVYLAAGWFNEAQMKQMNEIYEVLTKAEKAGRLKLFAPYYDGIVLKKDDPNIKKKMAMVWWLDIEMVRKSNLIIASTQDHDVGTIFECGYASALGKTIFCYNSNPELGLNVMLAQEARAFLKSKDDLAKAILHFEQNLNDSRHHPDPQERMRNYRYNLWEGVPI